MARLVRHRGRVPLLAAGFAAMIWGAWLGLVRLGWRLPLPYPDQLIAHGPLMVCGFLGTLIALERAVALDDRRAYAAPLLAAAGAVAAVAGPPGPLAPALITLGSVGLLAIYAAVLRRQAALFTAVMALGGAMWLAGNALWVSGWSINRFVLWWAGFLVLTIAGERLELNRLLRPSPLARASFIVTVGVLVAGVAITTRNPGAGVRVAGVGLIALSLWLARNDVARRTVRQAGLPRFIAVCLLAGYAWLAVSGALAATARDWLSGPRYDAALHALFLGFVFSMIFAHAPIILPAVLGVRMRYGPVSYAHLVVLHASLVVRVAGDLVEEWGRWRAWGALVNGLALLLFILTTIRSARDQSAEAGARTGVPFPREHGAYGQLAFPLVAGLALGRFSLAPALLASAAIGAFLAHEPIIVLLGNRGGRAAREHGGRAAVWLAIVIVLTLACGGAALTAMPPGTRWSVVLPFLLSLPLLPAIAARKERTAAAEILVAVTLSSWVVPVALAGGAGLRDAVTCWAVFGAAFTAATLAVRAVIARARAPRERREAAIAAVGFTVVAGVAAGLLSMAGAAPSAAPAALAPVGAVALVLALSPPAPRHLHRVGWVLVAASLTTTLVLVVGLR